MIVLSAGVNKKISAVLVRNVANLAGFAKAVSLLDEQTKADLQKRYAGFKQQIIQQLKDHDVDFAINAHFRQIIYNTSLTSG